MREQLWKNICFPYKMTTNQVTQILRMDPKSNGWDHGSSRVKSRWNLGSLLSIWFSYGFPKILGQNLSHQVLPDQNQYITYPPESEKTYGKTTCQQWRLCPLQLTRNSCRASKWALRERWPLWHGMTWAPQQVHGWKKQVIDGISPIMYIYIHIMCNYIYNGMNYGLLGYTWITNHGSDSWDAHPSMRAAQYGTLNTVSSYRMAPPSDTQKHRIWSILCLTIWQRLKFMLSSRNMFETSSKHVCLYIYMFMFKHIHIVITYIIWYNHYFHNLSQFQYCKFTQKNSRWFRPHSGLEPPQSDSSATGTSPRHPGCGC